MAISVRLPTTFAALAAALAVAAWDQAAAFDVIAPQPADPLAQTEAAAEAAAPAETVEPSDWSALNWRPGMNAADRSKRTGLKASATSSASATSWSRTDNPDGTAAVTVKRSLPTSWETNVGADFITAPPPRGLSEPVDPAALLAGPPADPSAGTAWASLATPALDTSLGWDKASIEARVDPTHEQGKIGVSASKALGGQLSLTLQSGYSVADPFASGTAVPAPAPTAVPPGTPVYTTEQAARLTILPTQTAVAAGRTMSTAEARWLHTLSAEQALFAGASLVGSVSESVDGPLTSSIIAKYQRRW
jgi:hypothetical protein